MSAYPSPGAWQSPSLDMNYKWNYPASQSPNTMVNQYNDLLQRAADFYTTLDHSAYDSRSSSISGVSDRSYGSTPDRHMSGSVIAQVQKSIPDKIERRREQNRSSQRAYRERKERHQRNLERQITEWQHKHQLLASSYGKQTQELFRLKSQIEQLNGEITALQNGLPSLCGSLNQSPAEFDLVPFYDPSSISPSAPRLRKSFPRG